MAFLGVSRKREGAGGVTRERGKREKVIPGALLAWRCGANPEARGSPP